MKDEEKKGTDFAQLEMMVKRGREKREAKSLVGRPKETRLSLGTQPRREKKSQPAHNWELVEGTLDVWEGNHTHLMFSSSHPLSKLARPSSMDSLPTGRLPKSGDNAKPAGAPRGP